MCGKTKIKIIIDFLMILLLTFLMLYQITGEKAHILFGILMFVLFIAHNLLNIGWYKSLNKGRYKPSRIFRTIINLSIMVIMLLLIGSGVVLSSCAFSSLRVISRNIHFAGSYWAFVLINMHLGIHWKLISGLFNSRLVASFLFQTVAFIVVLYGAIYFWKTNILSYMFLRTSFAYLDYDKSFILIFVDYLSMMGLWMFVGYHLSKLLSKKL